MLDTPAPAQRMLKYTICFICHGEHVLMLRRRYPPLAGKLNGVGGKLEPGESPLECVVREVAEETGILLSTAPRFGGVVTWAGHSDERQAGMYAYTAALPAGSNPEEIAGETEEGVLSWEPLARVLAGHPPVVENLPCFLGSMLSGAEPAEYRLAYDGDLLLGHDVRPLPADLVYALCNTAKEGSGTYAQTSH